MFYSVSCSKKHLREVLENKTYTVWQAIEDKALEDSDSIEYRHLLKTKGPEELERRMKFLGIG